jgi:hypothetical protein
MNETSMMRTCGSCGWTNVGPMDACLHCAAPLAPAATTPDAAAVPASRFCPTCGAPTVSGDRFCGRCGTTL